MRSWDAVRSTRRTVSDEDEVFYVDEADIDLNPRIGATYMRHVLGHRQTIIARSRELEMRWEELSAFTPVFRTHEGLNPAISAQWDTDAATQAHFARMARIYSALSFYRKDLVDEAARTGHPVVRHVKDAIARRTLTMPMVDHVGSMRYKRSALAGCLRCTAGHLAGLLRSVALNALIPLALYHLTKRYVSGSDVVALIVAGLFPLGESIVGLTRTRVLDPIAVLVLLGILVSMVGLEFGGGVKLLLIRESFFTGALGIVCFASLLLPRPLMFYFGRHFVGGQDPERVAQFNASWQGPYFRYVNRLITVVWGVAYTAEFLARVALVYTLPPSVVLVVSPMLLGSITIATIVWTFAYIRYAAQRGEAMRREQRRP